MLVHSHTGISKKDKCEILIALYSLLNENNNIIFFITLPPLYL